MNRISIFEGNIRIMNNEENQVKHECYQLESTIKDNKKKLEQFKQLPYLVSNINEIIKNEEKEDELDSDYSCIIKTSTRQTIYLPVPGMVDVETLEPNEIVGVNKDSYLILDVLPKEYDSRVKAMELEDKPDI